MVALGMPIFLVTAEVRWFSPGQIPAEIQSWFAGLGTPLVQPERTDLYLPRTGAGLGIKLREGRLEIKARRRVHGSQDFAPGLSGEAETWVKWGFKFPAQFSGWPSVRKTRQILFYQVSNAGEVLPSTPGVMPHQGGGVELTHVWVGKHPWWTIGIEVFGPATKRMDVLTMIAAHIFNRGGVPQGLVKSCSYTQLLRGLIRETQ